MMADVILFFDTNADTMIATKTLKDAGVTAKMIPKPANVTSSSNLCLSIDAGVETQATSALSTAGVSLGGVVR
ncbi:MAG TPA: putative Se/S carrier-like protein [Candidatus Baltobacteraceae bacterium]|nr:putative Se/S carrier-like protein [Candidatus Baltobacteraceae bacterium]